ncbi:MAG: discoidin domain-containing protein [Myxococcales bacterium]|nr:discoidin domain-containing protein [Myxococcales bacterium]
MNRALADTRSPSRARRLAAALALVVGVAASAGRAEASATVAAGTHQSALRLAGLVAGEDTLTLGAPGWTSATLAVTVEPTALAWQGVETQRTTVSAPDDVTLAPTIAHPVGHTLRAVAAMTAAVGVAPGATAGGVRVEDAGGAEVSTVTIPAGAASASLSVATPATAGAYRLRATRDGASYDSAEVTVAALSYALEIACGVDTRVALGFEHRSCYARRRLNGVTHNGPSALPVTLSTATGAATAGSVTIPAGQNAAYFTLGGVSLGDDVVTASDASGTYAPASVAVTVVDGAFAWVGVDAARNTASARDDVYLYFRTPGSTTNLTARVGGPLALSLTEATAPDMVSFYAAASGGAAITSLPVSAGATSATIWVGTPSAPGTYRIHAALGSATGDSPAVTVDPPAYGLTLGGCPSGAATGVALLNDTCYVRRTLNGAFHSAATPLTVTFASATGAASVASVTIPANQSLAYLEVVGVAAGADTVTAAASGTSLAYPTATLPVSVVAPTVVWVGVDTPRNPLSSRDDLYARLDAQGFVLKPAVPLTVTASVAEATPPGIVALYPASTGTTPATTWTWPARTQYLPTVWVGQPATTGSYRVRLETPGVFVGDSPPVTVEPPVLTLRLPSCNGTTQTTARHLVNAGCYVRTTLNGATYAVPEPLTVTFASSAPDVVAPPPSVTIAAGQSSGAFDLTGVGLGSSVVTASAPGYASPESVPVVSGAGELVFSNIPSVVPFNGATWYVYTREVGGPYRAVAEALTIDVEAASPLVAVAPQVVVPARQQLVYGVRAWASGTGSTTVTASAPDFQPVMATVAASVASTGIAVPPGEELLTYLPGVTATASSQYAAANAPRAAVDHDLGTYWRSASHAADAPQWLELALPSEATVTALWYQPGAVATYAPAVATFTFYGADDAELGALEDVALPASGGPVALGPGAPIAGVVLVRMDVTAPAAQQHLYDDVGEIVLVGTED